MTGARPLLILGWKGQGQICTLNFASFPHDNSITFLHTIMILHTWVHHDPRRTYIDFWVIWSKVKVKCGLWTLQIFRTITITFWTTMMILEACVACDMRSNPIDFGVKVKHRMVYFFVSAPEPKAHVHYCNHALSVVRPSSVLNFSHFRLLLLNRWTEFNETWQEARSQCPLLSLCFSGRSEKQDGQPDLWLAETFSTSPLKPLNGIQRNLTGSKISTSSTKFVFFGPIGKSRWPPWPLIGWDIFDFSSETAERNSLKLDRKQDLNVLYQVWVFGLIGKTRWPPWPLIGWDIFDFSSETAERNSTKLDGKQILNVLYQVCVFQANRKNKMAALASDWLRHFQLFLWNP